MSTPGCYAGSILRVDLSTARVERLDTADYTRYVGGRGLGAKLYWDEVGPHVQPFAPENALVIVTGALTGIPGIGAARWQVYGRSPLAARQGFSYCNLGGTWGVALKSAGYDGVVISGKAERPTYLLIDEHGVSLRNASHLAGMGAVATREALKAELGGKTHVVAIGPAGENGVVFACLIADKGAAGAAGLGSVMGSKGLKAIAVRQGSHRLVVADPDRLRALIKRLRFLLGSAGKVALYTPRFENLRHDHCWGCSGPCIRVSYRAPNGKEDKFTCHPCSFYLARSQRYYSTGSSEFSFHAAHQCNEYGVDTKAIDIICAWLGRCVRAGIVSDESTGLPLSRLGSVEYIDALLRQVAFREGFGAILAQGVAQAASAIGDEAVAQIGDLMHKADESDSYGARLYIINGILYAMEPRQAMGQLHEVSFVVDAWNAWARHDAGAYLSGDALRAVARRFWGSEASANMTNYEHKALAAKKVQDRSYAKECLGLCEWMWPVLFSGRTTDNVGDSSLESSVFSAVTGRETDEEELSLIGARAVLLQRAIVVREGHRGRVDDCLPGYCFDMPLQYHSHPNREMLVPGPDGKPVSRQGAVLDRDAFERMKDEYYLLRGWDLPTGLPGGEALRNAAVGLLE